MRIETEIFRVLHCRIYLTTDSRREKLLSDKAFALAFKYGVDLEYFEGAPAAEPYLEASTPSAVKMHNWQWRFVSYLRKFTNVKYR